MNKEASVAYDHVRQHLGLPGSKTHAEAALIYLYRKA